MGKLLKIVLTIIASLILLIIIVALALPFFIDPNDFKPQIQTAVKDNTGRELSITGDLELSVFPWIGVTTGKLSLSNAPGFADKSFAEIGESNIKVKLLPLLSKKIEVSRIVLKGLVLNLAKNKQGISNWDDLSSGKDPDSDPGQQKPAESDESGNLLSALAIGGISIDKANISWDDQQAGKYTEIKEFNLNTDKLEFNEPVGIDISFTVINKEPQITESVDFSTELLINEKLDSIQFKKLQLNSNTSGKDIPGDNLKATLSTSDVAIDLEQQTLGISGLKLNTGDLTVSADIKGTSIKDQPSFQGPVKISEFNLAKFLQKMAISLPPMQDSSALSSLAVSFDLQATDNSAALQNLAIKLDDTTIKGNSSVINFTVPAIGFNLDVDSIDVDRYLAPKKEGESKPVASPASAAAAGAALFPVDTLRNLNISGDLTLGNLKISNMKMQGLSLKLDAKNGLLKTKQTIKQLYQGAYSGNTTINVTGKTPSIALNEKLSNVQIEPLLTDMQNEKARITGTVNAGAKLQGYGNTTKAIKSSLGGNLNFQFKDGVVRGFNIQKMIDNSKSLLDGSPLPTENKNDQTVFSEISGSAKINNGLVKNNDLKAISSKVHINGEGTANLATEQLSYKVHSKLIKKANADQPEKIKGIPLVIKVGGTFSDPSYSLDVQAMLEAKAKQKATKLLEKHKDKIDAKKDKILKKLDDKLGPGVGDVLKGFF